jgi:GNAT superfamily N-acetyltransferase
LTAIRIRPANRDDRTFVILAAERLAAFGPPPWRADGQIVEGEIRTLRAFFESPPDGAALLVAESQDGERLGFAYLERLHDYFTLEEHGHVGILAVAEAAEGKGAGSALMRAAEAWARERGYRRLTLTVFEGNRRARELYERLGYAAETTRFVKLL